MSAVPTIDRRGEGVAAAGLFVSVLGFTLLALLGGSLSSAAIFAAGWHLLGGAGIWLLILVQLHQLRLLDQERFELAELERERRERLGGAGTIFREEDKEQMDALAMGRRLRTLERWFVPTFAGVVAVYLALVGIRCLPGAWPFETIRDAATARVENASMLAFVAGAMAFVTFALSRYALGMSRIQGAGWTMLRAGGAYYFGTALAGLAAAVALALAHNGYEQFDRRLGHVIGGAMIVLAAEIVINFILDLYRPRVAGQPQRVFYESRLLAVFSEPEGIFRSAAQTIDYQFGFKVSETWFYRLLGRAVAPLLLFQAAVLYAMTCFVVVPQGHQAVVEELGFHGAGRWVAEPGVTLTWPWPLARATLIPTERIQRMELGYEPSREEREAGVSRAPILWSERHRAKEYQLLVADRAAWSESRVPVNLLSATVPLQWRVSRQRVLDYHRQAGDVEAIIESLAYRELTRLAAHSDLGDLMGRGGVRVADELRQSIQRACRGAGVDGGDLGVEIVHVGFGSVHPPQEVAEAYENVINAVEQRDTRIKQGETDAARTRLAAAGQGFSALYDAILAEEAARAADAADATRKSAVVERLLREAAEGAARKAAADAEEYLFRRVTLEGAAAELFDVQLRSHAAAPRVYRLRAYLDVLTESLAGLRKYVVAVRQPDNVLYQLDLRPPPPIEMLSQEVQSFGETGGR